MTEYSPTVCKYCRFCDPLDNVDGRTCTRDDWIGKLMPDSRKGAIEYVADEPWSMGCDVWSGVKGWKQLVATDRIMGNPLADAEDHRIYAVPSFESEELDKDENPIHYCVYIPTREAWEAGVKYTWPSYDIIVIIEDDGKTLGLEMGKKNVD